MKTTSISELKAHLSQYLAMVSQGTEVQILDRGVPVARLVGPGDSLSGDDGARVGRLVRLGLVRGGRGPSLWLVDKPALRVDGALSAAVDEDREDRA